MNEEPNFDHIPTAFEIAQMTFTRQIEQICALMQETGLNEEAQHLTAAAERLSLTLENKQQQKGNGFFSSIAKGVNRGILVSNHDAAQTILQELEPLSEKLSADKFRQTVLEKSNTLLAKINQHLRTEEKYTDKSKGFAIEA